MDGVGQTPFSRFQSKFIPEPMSGCWLWTAGATDGGYGKIRLGSKQLYAHRFSWLLHFGEIPDQKLVCHKCDTPLCVNPDHLFLGSPADNMADANRKGRLVLPRRVRGSPCSWAILSEADVVSIRASKSTNIELGKKYGVSNKHIGAIKRRAKWKHV